MLTTLLATMALQELNTLTPKEKREGWRLLFDGKTTNGWHNFKSNTIGAGWKVKDGVLSSSGPEHAGDIVTTEKFTWFELKFEYNIAKGQNAGVMFHVANEGEATWHTGPEFQLLDNSAYKGGQMAGWLYDLYSAKVDATKPSGEWNTLRIVIRKKKCLSEMNGVKYVEFQLGSEDFKARVAKSKFSVYPNFGKLGTGSIAIQGDHGVVSYRNMKIRTFKD